MRDAFGGIVNIVFVAIFLLIISGILGLIVNYTKAFRMKNTVISAIEQYEGAKGCFSDQATGETGCRDKILKGAEAIGYHPPTIICSKEEGYTLSDNLFCYKREKSDSGKHYVYTVITQVDINIPIINRIMGLDIFRVHGDTRPVLK